MLSDTSKVVTFFFQAEDGIRDGRVTGVQTCALPILIATDMEPYRDFVIDGVTGFLVKKEKEWRDRLKLLAGDSEFREKIGRASCRGRRWRSGVGRGSRKMRGRATGAR